MTFDVSGLKIHRVRYNELLRLVHYNRQGEGYNETEKPEKYAKFHYI